MQQKRFGTDKSGLDTRFDAQRIAFAPVVFQGGLVFAILAMPLWGIGYATQDTLLKALIASVLPEGRRNFAFGLFYVGYGVGWLIGSIAIGFLYERSHFALVAFVVAAQLLSLPGFVLADRMARRKRTA